MLVDAEQPDSGALLKQLYDWCDGRAELLQTVLADTPAKLYGFNG